MTKSKELVSYSWKPLSPEASTFSPFTHTQRRTRTSRTFCTFAIPQPIHQQKNPSQVPDGRLSNTFVLPLTWSAIKLNKLDIELDHWGFPGFSIFAAILKNSRVYIVHNTASLLCSDIILQHLMTSFFMDLNDLHILLWILKSWKDK